MITATAIAAFFISSGLYTTDCGMSNVQVESVSFRDTITACKEIKRTVAFFTEMGYDVSNFPIDMGVVNTNPNSNEPASGSVLGEFNRLYESDVDDYSIVFVAYDTFSEAFYANGYTELFGLPLSYMTWSSVVNHELGHLYLHHLTNGNLRLSSAAHEYVAYTVQFVLLPADVREEIIAYFKPKDVENLSYLITNGAELLPADPDYFGVLSYKSFIEDPSFFYDMLRNCAEFAPPRYYMRKPANQRPDYINDWAENYNKGCN